MIYKLNLHFLKVYPHTEKRLSRSKISKLVAMHKYTDYCKNTQLSEIKAKAELDCFSVLRLGVIRCISCYVNNLQTLNRPMLNFCTSRGA